LAADPVRQKQNRTVIREILKIEPIAAIREALDCTKARLAKDAHASDLVPRVESLLVRLDAISTSGLGAQADLVQLEQLVRRINEERCALFGELTGRACKEKLQQSWPSTFFFPVPPAPPAPPAFRMPGPRGPDTIEGWLNVARERAQDGSAMISARPTSAGPVYMMGYGIECSLKGYLKSQRRAFPTSGRAGHDLRALWEAAGFRLSDINDKNGAKTFYIERWSTDLRYAAVLPDSTAPGDLLRAAHDLIGWIQQKAKRTRSAR
jgi:hypothetical protein